MLHNANNSKKKTLKSESHYLYRKTGFHRERDSIHPTQGFRSFDLREVKRTREIDKGQVGLLYACEIKIGSHKENQEHDLGINTIRKISSR